MKSSNILLFTGDSITCADREAGKNELGKGYVNIINEELKREKYKYKVVNRGCDGFRVTDLVRFWEEDCIKINPYTVTVLIGVNEVLNRFEGRDIIDRAAYYDYYNILLKETSEKTNARIILIEPFIFPFPQRLADAQPYIYEEILAVRDLAKKYHTGYIYIESIFAKAVLKYGYRNLTTDGVHLTTFGHKIIAEEWLKEFKGLF